MGDIADGCYPMPAACDDGDGRAGYNRSVNMDRKHESASRETVGNLCVVRDESLNHWTVLICPGAVGERKPLKTFGTRSEAEAFARDELAKLNAGGAKKTILHVDDCPCWQKQL